MGGECGSIWPIQATSVPIDDLVLMTEPTPVTSSTNAGGRPPITASSRSGKSAVGGHHEPKKGQGSQGTESPLSLS